MKNINILRLTILLVLGILILIAGFNLRRYIIKMEVLESQYQEFKLLQNKINQSGVLNRQ